MILQSMKPKLTTPWSFTTQEQGRRLGLWIEHLGYTWNSIFELSFDYWMVRNLVPYHPDFRKHFFESSLCLASYNEVDGSFQLSPKYSKYLCDELLIYWDTQIWPRIKIVLPEIATQLQLEFRKINTGGAIPDRRSFIECSSWRFSISSEEHDECPWSPSEDYKFEQSCLYGDDFTYFE